MSARVPRTCHSGKSHYWFFLCSVFSLGVFLTTGSSKLSNIQLVLSFSKGEAGSDVAFFGRGGSVHGWNLLWV